MPQRTIIGLCGFAHSGKDTVGGILVNECGFTRDAFADDLKRALLAIDPYIPLAGDTGRVGIERLSDRVELVGWDVAKTHPEVRRLLGVAGTEGGWMIHGKRLWVDRVDERMRKLPAERPLVVTDVRFPEEQDWLTENGGTLVEIVRPSVGALPGVLGTHSSEATSMLHPDRVIHNDASIAALRLETKQLLDTL